MESHDCTHERAETLAAETLATEAVEAEAALGKDVERSRSRSENCFSFVVEVSGTHEAAAATLVADTLATNAPEAAATEAMELYRAGKQRGKVSDDAADLDSSEGAHGKS